MSGLLDSKNLQITCTKCAHKFKQPVRRLKNDPKLTCPGCGAIIAVKAEGLREGLKSADKRIADFRQNMRRLGK